MIPRRPTCTTSTGSAASPVATVPRTGTPGHGSGNVLNRSDCRKRSTVRIRPDEVDRTLDLLREFERFREIAAEFLEAGEALAEARRANEAAKRGVLEA